MFFRHARFVDFRAHQLPLRDGGLFDQELFGGVLRLV
jgi:hypothetical protein